jgi:hypothetical protein
MGNYKHFKTQIMKKVLFIAVVALAATFVACGPSAEEKAKMEENAKRQADSIAKALEASLNSAVNEATTPDSTAAATTETTAPAEGEKH